MERPQSQNIEQRLEELQRTVEQYRSAVAELQLLNDIAVTAGASVDLDQTLRDIVERTLKAFGGEQGAILLLTDGSDKPFKTLIRQDEHTKLQPHYDFLTAITGWVLAHEEALVVPDLSVDLRFSASAEERNQVRSVLCAPIWFEGSIIGLITILNRKGSGRFTSDDLTLLTIIAVQAGQLIKNADRRAEALRRMQEADAARWESEKLKDIDRLKSNLFTAIAHELRTPLTLILGPLEQLQSGAAPGDPQRHYALMQQQAGRLLRRVNDLLSLATIDAGVMTLSIARCDMALLVKRAAASFESAAHARDIVLRVQTPLPAMDVYCDAEKVDTILTNLIANALKFTHGGGTIDVSLQWPPESSPEAAWFMLSVADTGIGIPASEQSRIFERFRKSPFTPTGQSTGIGLALVKELVDLHSGTIDVNSVPGAGTRFTLRIPGAREFYETRGIPVAEASPDLPGLHFPARAVSSAPPQRGAADASAAQVLIVEDDDDLREFIRQVIQPAYAVDAARDGEEALAMAFERMPDLIVSDVLMPGMDGLTLCARLRRDERTSHIPVILLTSRAELESKLEGLETGADDYLAKPFSPKELSVRIANLLEQRRLLRERYRRQITLEPKDVAITSADEAFLDRLLRSVEAHLGDPEFGVERLAHDAAMSKTHLNRKLRALTDQTANEFIRSFRLKKAATMLMGRSGNVSEVAYDVGFSNPSYFAEVFREAFGCSPSEFARKTPDRPDVPPA